MRTIIIAVALTFTSLATGCCMPGVHCPGNYETEFWNATLYPMDAVVVRWKMNGQDIEETSGLLNSSLETNFGNIYTTSPEPIPKSVLAYWKTGDGKEQVKEVEVASRVPDIDHFTGKIVFKFYDNDVVVLALPYWLEARNLRLGKGTMP